MRKLFNRIDVFIIVAVLLSSFLLFLPGLFSNNDLVAQIYVDGEVTEEINLNEVLEPYTFSPKEGTVISVKNGTIHFSEAVCRDKLCINSGELSSKGQTAACLPERIVITIKGADKTDMITY